MKLSPNCGQHHIADRIRFITDKDSAGTIVSRPFHSPHGGLRQDVRWDRSGEVTAWNPIFLVPIDCDDADIPDRISDSSGYVYNKSNQPRVERLLAKWVRLRLRRQALLESQFGSDVEVEFEGHRVGLQMLGLMDGFITDLEELVAVMKESCEGAET